MTATWHSVFVSEWLRLTGVRHLCCCEDAADSLAYSAVEQVESIFAAPKTPKFSAPTLQKPAAPIVIRHTEEPEEEPSERPIWDEADSQTLVAYPPKMQL
mmetsp:Transcript_2517/g.5785  ORF Transcript_2517/g.5785 Transcript_2517/m.5785 type:complete len:100 (+) Transcript_2517:77-376(+)|eukprot:CAMPEP_0170653354 /NCGR_PEP_ID=MMETSP0224-20130122/47363_1 /TAXON_ID=285029 /ORGANISM="Togula jolla, Strain CCCM 725" /LENGTH=99 /DNA_ID=CAMNT_0010985221 /DNA_START=1 /DNA_END=300 /DNA_ORIENTATION=+